MPLNVSACCFFSMHFPPLMPKSGDWEFPLFNVALTDKTAHVWSVDWVLKKGASVNYVRTHLSYPRATLLMRCADLFLSFVAVSRIVRKRKSQRITLRLQLFRTNPIFASCQEPWNSAGTNSFSEKIQIIKMFYLLLAKLYDSRRLFSEPVLIAIIDLQWESRSKSIGKTPFLDLRREWRDINYASSSLSHSFHFISSHRIA